ncbi:MAG: response regulator transcription factor [Acidobacteriota bacterium]
MSTSTTSAAKVLLVEDDERIRCELMDALCAAGFDVAVSLGLAGARRALETDHDLVLLDLGLPDGDGLDLCRELRNEGRSIPVIILTARDAPEQRVRGLDVGADDYVVKPFHLPELLARVRSVLRRSGRAAGPGRVRWQDLWADPESRVAQRGDRRLDLTPTEFDLLLFFLRHPGRTWTRDQLLDRVWGSSGAGSQRTVDLCIRRLRSKLEDDASDPRYVGTVWGVGYRMGEPS